MSNAPDSQRHGGAPSARGLGLMVAGVMLTGGLAGLVLNRASAASGGSPGGRSPARPLARSTGAVAAATGAETSPAGPDALDALEIRTVKVVPPEDPFQPTEPPAAAEEPSALPQVTAAPPGAGLKPAAGSVTPASVKPGVRKPSPAKPAVAALLPEELVVVGIVKGDPALAVVQHNGKSYFLKIGDQVEDTWRLREIKERSAVFQLGAQRVEIPITGGS